MAIKITGTTVVDDSRKATFDDNVVVLTGKYLTVTELPPNAIGDVAGYTTGGSLYPAYSTRYNDILKFNFASDSTVTTTGGLTTAYRFAASGQSSSTFGYTSGGYIPPGNYTQSNIIDKFPFASNANATDVGDLTTTTNYSAGQSSQTHGYVSRSGIQKFSFSSDGNATSVGNLSQSRSGSAGQSSSTHGYNSGGRSITNVIDRFPFSSDSPAVDVGDLTLARFFSAGQTSSTHGYTSGGTNAPMGTPGANYSTIDKFPFATNTNATSVGSLTQARGHVAGQSSTTHGYTSGGFVSSPIVSPSSSVNTIDKTPYASDANAVDVGDLVSGRHAVSGNQD